MKRFVMFASLAVALFFTANDTVVWARGAADVANGLHNLSVTGGNPLLGPTGTIYVTDEDEICVFCHTPHGGSLTGQLWNREDPTGVFTHYNSASLTDYIRVTLSAARAVSNESLLCMSCHDGSISVNHLINVPNDRTTPITTIFGGGEDTEIAGIPGVVGARIGASLNDTMGTGDLSDDHPISFSYSSVWAQDIYQTGSRMGELHNTTDAVNAGVRFFGSTQRVECSSCHDPHVDYITQAEYTPFLITSNSGSKLCLACHNK